MVILIEIVLLAGTVLFVGYPLFSKRYQAPLKGDMRVNDYQRLLSRRDMIYSAIKDLEFDYKTGKLSEEDYEELKSQYESEAVEILEKIDKSGKGKAGVNVGEKKRLLCPECNSTYSKNDKFCSKCGSKLL